MFPALRPFLNKGGAGYSISRAETAERLRPLIERHLRLLQAYAAARPRLRALPGGEAVEAMLPYLRTDLSKLYESAYSAGARIPSGAGTDFPPGASGSDADVVQHLLELEKETREAAHDEVDAVHHQERTRAILKTLVNGADARAERLRAVAGQVRRGPVHAE